MADNTNTELEEIEIFSTGKWNGDIYTEDDLNEIVDSFNEIGEVLKPYLKLGHDNNQALLQKDGLPSAGWVKKLERKGQKLVAFVSDMPKKIKELIRKKAYKRVSSEIFWNLKHEGKTYRRALKAIALLGSDLPAVNNLDDIIALYEAEFDAELKTYHELEDSMDDVKKYKDEINELETEIKNYKKEAEEKEKEHKEYIEKTEKELKKYKDENESLKAEKEEIAKKARETEIETVIKAGVEAGKVLPSQVEMYTKLAETDIESVKNIIESNEKMVEFTAETNSTQPDQKTHSNDKNEDPDITLDKKIRAYMKENDMKEEDYVEAFHICADGGE